MATTSAGILLFRRGPSGVEVLLVHPGGPYWARKDAGAWSIPKGVCEPGEEPLPAAKREFAEETGASLRSDGFVELGRFRQPSGKIIIAYAVEGEFDLAAFQSNSFAMEWPPGSGVSREFPEVDRAAWFGPDEATRKIGNGQKPILEAFLQRVIGPTG
jgi:predicted NUDIX family NTP pyrophosphohydrolase